MVSYAKNKELIVKCPYKCGEIQNYDLKCTRFYCSCEKRPFAVFYECKECHSKGFIKTSSSIRSHFPEADIITLSFQDFYTGEKILKTKARCGCDKMCPYSIDLFSAPIPRDEAFFNSELLRISTELFSYNEQKYLDEKEKYTDEKEKEYDYIARFTKCIGKPPSFFSREPLGFSNKPMPVNSSVEDSFENAIKLICEYERYIFEMRENNDGN